MNTDKPNTQEEAQDGYRHALKYTGIFGGVQGLKILMNIVRTKLTSVFIGTYGMGLNAIYQKIAELINSSTNLGLSFSSLRSLSELYEDGTEDEKRHFILLIRTWCLWTALVGGLLCLLLTPVFTHFYFPTGDSHTKEIMLVSLFVASMPIEAGECSILKGLRQLKSVAKVELLCALFTFLLTVPIYYLLGVYGVILSLVMCGWAMAIIHLCYSCRLYRYRVNLFSRELLREGWPLVKIGVPYVLAAIAGASTTNLIFLTISDTHQIGLFQAGYNLMVTYGGMVFVAMEADYFPRLSSVNHDCVRMNRIINQQIDVCVTLMTPMLIVMVLFMSHILYLLYTTRFIAIAPMAVLAVYHMFCKAVTLPVAYTPLAKGDSVVYLLMEMTYDVAYLLLIYVGFKYGSLLPFTFDGVSCGGLAGTGVALSAAGFFDMFLIIGFYSYRYHFRMRRRTFVLILAEMACLTVVLPFCLTGSMHVMKYTVGLLSLFVSSIVAVRYMMRNGDLLDRVKRKFGRQA